jgi:hypothetical protein
MLRRRRAAQINRQSVPYGMEKVEYLRTTGTQYINTNVYAKSGLFTKLTVKVNEWTGWNNINIVFAHKTNLTETYALSLNYNSGYGFAGFFWYGNQAGYLNTQHALDTKYEFEIDGPVLKRNNEKLTYRGGGSIIDNEFEITASPLHLFHFIGHSETTRMSLYNFTIQDKSHKLINLKPCIDRTGTPCFYDKVTRKNFYNMGTKDFQYPHLITDDDLKNFTPLEYIESTGTQYIYTGLNGQNLSVEIDYQSLPITSTTNDQAPFGLYRNADTSYYLVETNDAHDVPNCIRAVIGGQTINVGSRDNSLGVQDKTKFKFDAQEGKIYLNDEVLSDNIDFSNITDHVKLNIFGLGQYGVVTNRRSNMRLFSLKCWKSGVLVRDYKPYLDNNGKPCLVDLVNKEIYYNEGTGEFLYPSPTQSTTYSMRRPQVEYAKMTDTGIRRLYHVPADYEGSLEDYAMQCGYKQLIETESPNEEGKYYSFRWVETDDTLTTEWFEVDPPQEEFIEEILDNPTE